VLCVQVTGVVSTAGYSYRPHLPAKSQFVGEINIHSVTFWVMVQGFGRADG